MRKVSTPFQEERFYRSADAEALDYLLSSLSAKDIPHIPKYSPTQDLLLSYYQLFFPFPVAYTMGRVSNQLPTGLLIRISYNKILEKNFSFRKEATLWTTFFLWTAGDYLSHYFHFLNGYKRSAAHKSLDQQKRAAFRRFKKEVFRALIIRREAWAFDRNQNPSTWRNFSRLQKNIERHRIPKGDPVYSQVFMNMVLWHCKTKTSSYDLKTYALLVNILRESVSIIDFLSRLKRNGKF